MNGLFTSEPKHVLLVRLLSSMLERAQVFFVFSCCLPLDGGRSTAVVGVIYCDYLHGIRAVERKGFEINEWGDKSVSE